VKRYMTTSEYDRAHGRTLLPAGSRKQGRRRDGMTRGDGALGHSVSAERKFFDQVRDLLSSTSRDSWGEFVKVLELFTKDAITKKDLLELVRALISFLPFFLSSFLPFFFSSFLPSFFSLSPFFLSCLVSLSFLFLSLSSFLFSYRLFLFSNPLHLSTPPEGA